MGKLVVSLDGVVIKEVQITKDKTTLGRRPYNDIVIDNLAVSGEHAVLQMAGADVFIEDLNSTNGTYINGKAIKKQLLAHNDTVEIGKYKIKFLIEEGANEPDRNPVTRSNTGGAAFSSAAAFGASPTAGSSALASGGASGGGAGSVTATSPLSSGSLPGSSSSSVSNSGANLAPNFGPADSAAVAAGMPAVPTAHIKVLNGAAAGREVALSKVVTTVGKPGVQVASITKRPNGYAFSHVEGASRPSVNGVPLSGDSVPLRNGDVIELAGTQMQFVYR